MKMDIEKVAKLARLELTEKEKNTLGNQLEQILTYMGFSLGIFPLLAVFGVFKLRKRGLSSYRMPGYPLLPCFYLLAGTAILCLAFLERPVPSLIALATVAVGVPAYYLFKKLNPRSD